MLNFILLLIWIDMSRAVFADRMRQEHFTLREAAKQVGIAPVTLKRWLLSRKVREVRRDRNGWRIFTRKDIERIKKYKTKTVAPPTAR